MLQDQMVGAFGAWLPRVTSATRCLYATTNRGLLQIVSREASNQGARASSKSCHGMEQGKVLKGRRWEYFPAGLGDILVYVLP